MSRLHGYFSFGPLNALYYRGDIEYIRYINIEENDRAHGVVGEGTLSTTKAFIKRETYSKSISFVRTLSRLKAAKYVISHKLKVDIKNLFAQANRYGHFRLIKYLVKNTEEITTDELSYRLVWGCVGKNLTMVKFYYLQGANLQMQNGDKAINNACEFGNYDTVKYLMYIMNEDYPSSEIDLGEIEISNTQVAKYFTEPNKRRKKTNLKFIRILSIKELLKNL